MRGMVLGLLAYLVLGLTRSQTATLWIATTGLVVALVALAWCVANWLAIRKITDDQAQRIDQLQSPDGG